MNSIIFVSLLVAAIAISLAEAQILPVPVALNANISGIVSCSANASVPGTPAFPNATVALQCGGTVLSTNTTAATGAFSIGLNGSVVTQALLTSLLTPGACNVSVLTGLVNCNATLGPLPGILTSGLQLTEITAQGARVLIFNFLASLFRLI